MTVFEYYMYKKEIEYTKPTGVLAHNPTGELVKYLVEHFNISCKNYSL